MFCTAIFFVAILQSIRFANNLNNLHQLCHLQKFTFILYGVLKTGTHIYQHRNYEKRYGNISLKMPEKKKSSLIISMATMIIVIP